MSNRSFRLFTLIWLVCTPHIGLSVASYAPPEGPRYDYITKFHPGFRSTQSLTLGELRSLAEKDIHNIMNGNESLYGFGKEIVKRVLALLTTGGTSLTVANKGLLA